MRRNGIGYLRWRRTWAKTCPPRCSCPFSFSNRWSRSSIRTAWCRPSAISWRRCAGTATGPASCSSASTDRPSPGPYRPTAKTRTANQLFCGIARGMLMLLNWSIQFYRNAFGCSRFLSMVSRRPQHFFRAAFPNATSRKTRVLQLTRDGGSGFSVHTLNFPFNKYQFWTNVNNSIVDGPITKKKITCATSINNNYK